MLVLISLLQDSSPNKMYPLKEATVKVDKSNGLVLTFPDIQRSGELVKVYTLGKVKWYSGFFDLCQKDGA